MNYVLYAIKVTGISHGLIYKNCSQEEYTKDRRLSKLGSAIASGVAASDVRIPVDQALYIQCYARLGKAGYTDLRLSLLPYGVIFPPYNEIADYKYQNIVPTKMVYS